MKTWSFRACALTAALLVLSPLFVPLAAHARDTVLLCNTTSSPIVAGSGLTSFEHVDYSNDGWVQFHFKFDNPSTRKLYIIFNRKYASSCDSKAFYITDGMSLPENVTRFSFRASSYSAYQAYDDDTNLPIKCSFCQVQVSAPMNSDTTDHLMLQMVLTDDSGSLLSTSQPLWDPSRPLPLRPVIIIPGATGTTLTKGSSLLWPDLPKMLISSTDNFMDPLAFKPDLTPTDPEVQPGQVIDKMKLLDTIPLFDYTGGLIQALTDAGYKQGKSLFVFPYDWRQSIQTSASKLEDFVNQIQQQTGFWYLNAIAHSMGGLVLKQYTDQTSLGHFDKAVFVGTPFLGAPKALKTLLFGDNLNIPVLSNSEIKKISTNMPGLYQLLPSRRYYDHLGSALGLTQPLTYDETKDFGINQGLNAMAWQAADTLHSERFDTLDLGYKGINVYNVVSCATPTLSRLRMNEGQSPIFTWGDGTVPTLSAIYTPLDAGKTIFSLKSDHAHLLSTKGISEQIVRLLNGDTKIVDPNLTLAGGECGLSGLLISVFSPLDMTAVSSGGQIVGRGPDGQIRQDLQTAGYEEMGDHKFLFWPDSAGTPTINLQGTDTGTFTLSVETIKNNESSNTITYKDIPVTASLLGQLDLGNSSNLLLDVDGDGHIDKTLTGDTIPPEIGVTFDPSTHNLVFTGQDNSGTATITEQGSTITATDAVGNTAVLQLDRQPGKKSLRVLWQALSYNGEAVSVSKAQVNYTWSSDNLTQDLSVGSSIVRAVFDGKNTKITIKTGSGKGQVQTVSGLALLKMVTYQGNVNWSW